MFTVHIHAQEIERYAVVERIFGLGVYADGV
jgi:hypothetical protein